MCCFGVCLKGRHARDKTIKKSQMDCCVSPSRLHMYSKHGERAEHKKTESLECILGQKEQQKLLERSSEIKLVNYMVCVSGDETGGRVQSEAVFS